MDLGEIELGDMDCIRLVQEGPVVGSCEHGHELSGSINCWEILV
jgi:hypothetical protein